MNFEVELAEFDGGVDQIFEFVGLTLIAREVKGFLEEQLAYDGRELRTVFANGFTHVFSGCRNLAEAERRQDSQRPRRNNPEAI